SNAAELKTLEKALHEVFSDVRLSVADFQPMKAKAKELRAWLDKAKLKVEGAELEEVKVFMNWLLDDHFTFLGYEEFTVADSADGGRVVYDEKSLLGLSKRLRAGLTADDTHIEAEAVSYLRGSQLLSFAKAAVPSRVH
ncbi:NAD-glutamate dehydrogenase, partial [Myxococcus sp. AM001]|nr:NAD-glutamate dehydrogenase [Myxococcus sp. AM001]